MYLSNWKCPFKCIRPIGSAEAVIAVKNRSPELPSAHAINQYFTSFTQEENIITLLLLLKVFLVGFGYVIILNQSGSDISIFEAYLTMFRKILETATMLLK